MTAYRLLYGGGSSARTRPNEAAVRARVNQLQQVFKQLLNAAIALGQFPVHDSGLAPATLDALAAVARSHPDASAELIAAAGETFTREHIAPYNVTGKETTAKS